MDTSILDEVALTLRQAPPDLPTSRWERANQALEAWEVAAERRSMAKGKDRTVYKRDDGKWVNKRNDADRAGSVHGAQRDAIGAAKDMLGNSRGGELTVTGVDGKIRE